MVANRDNKLFFTSLEDICDWDKQIAYCDVIDLPEEERNWVKDSLKYLREVFGSDFLKAAFLTKHNLIHTIANQAPWTRKWLAWLADTVRGVDDAGSRKDLIKRLKNPHSYAETVSVLKVLYQFTSSGFRCEIDPAIIIGGIEKKPDLLFTDPDSREKLFVEVTEVRKSDEEKRAEQTLKIISDHLIRKSFMFSHCGAIHQILDELKLRRVVEKIDRIIALVAKEGGLQEIEDEEFQIAIVRKEDEDRLRVWAQSKGLKINWLVGLVGPTYDEKPIRRVLRKIGRKQKQLPLDVPSIVFIWNPQFLIQIGDIESVAADLSDRAEMYQQVYAIVVAGDWLGPGANESRYYGKAILLSKQRLEIMESRILAVLNPNCKINVSSGLKNRIRKALEL